MSSLTAPVPVYEIKAKGGNLFVFRHGEELAVFCAMDDEVNLQPPNTDQWLMLRDTPKDAREVIGALIEKHAVFTKIIAVAGTITPAQAATIYEHCTANAAVTRPDRYDEISKRVAQIAKQHAQTVTGKGTIVLDVSVDGTVVGVDSTAPPLDGVAFAARKVPIWDQLLFRREAELQGAVYAVSLPRRRTAYFEVIEHNDAEGARATRSEPLIVENHESVAGLPDLRGFRQARWGGEQGIADDEFGKAWDAIDREINKPPSVKVWNDVKDPLGLATAVTAVTLLYHGIKERVNRDVEKKIAERAKANPGKNLPAYARRLREWGDRATLWSTGFVALLGGAVLMCGKMIMQGAQQRLLDGERQPNPQGTVTAKDVVSDAVHTPSEVGKDLAEGVKLNELQGKQWLRRVVEGVKAVDEVQNRGL